MHTVHILTHLAAFLQLIKDNFVHMATLEDLVFNKTRDVQIVSQLLEILNYFQHSCPVPHVNSSVSIYWIFNGYTGQCPA